MRKKMKKLLLSIAMILITTVAHAQSITVINNGKPGGSSDARTKMYTEGLSKLGYDVNFENISKMGVAVDFFIKSNDPTLMVYYSHVPVSQPLSHNSENFVMIEYAQPMYLCGTKSLQQLPDKVTVAYGKNYNPQMVEKLVNALGKTATVVPYKNSSAVLEAILGGDVDVAFNNQGKTLKYINSGKGQCFGHTGNSQTIGIDPIASDFDMPVMYATVIAKNVDIEKLRKEMLWLQETEMFVEYHTSKQLTKQTSDRNQELLTVKKSETAWK